MITLKLSYLLAERMDGIQWAIKQNTKNDESYQRNMNELEFLCKEFMPSGAGFDNGTKILIPESAPNRLKFHTDFHHMNKVGMYDGWTYHSVTAMANFIGMDVKVSGINRDNIKDYIASMIVDALDQNICVFWNPETREHIFLKKLNNN